MLVHEGFFIPNLTDRESRLVHIETTNTIMLRYYNKRNVYNIPDTINQGNKSMFSSRTLNNKNINQKQ